MLIHERTKEYEEKYGKKPQKRLYAPKKLKPFTLVSYDK